MWRKLFVKFQMDQKWTNFWDNRMDDFERNLNLKIDCNSLSVAIEENFWFDVHLFGLQNWIVPIFLMKKKTKNAIWIAFSIR